MAKEIVNKIKLQIPAGRASAAPPVGTALGPAGIPLPDFVNRFNEATRKHLDWIAQYSENNTYNYAWRGWQYTDAGKIPGINTDVDLSIFLY